jgi:Putative phage metallopeptidase
MAKFQTVFEDTNELFFNFIKKIDSLNDVNISILANNSLKVVGKVVKATDLLHHMTQVDIIILLNETVFELLDDQQKAMVIEELVASIYYDFEKSKVTLVKPDVNTYSLLLRKFGYTEYERLVLTLKEAFSQAEDNEDCPQTDLDNG